QPRCPKPLHLSPASVAVTTSPQPPRMPAKGGRGTWRLATTTRADETGNSTRPRAPWPGTTMWLLGFYLAGPLLTLGELLHPLLAGLLLLAVALAARTLAVALPAAAQGPPSRLAWLAGGAVVVLAVGWILASGIGSYAFCRSDYVKHLFI